MAEPPRPDDLKRRYEAARGYGRLSRKGLEAKFKTNGTQISESSILRAEREGENQRDPDRSELLALAELVNLPVEFFYADFSRLKDIVPPIEESPYDYPPETADPPDEQDEPGAESR